MGRVAQNENWVNYFADYEKNQSYSNPIYNITTDSDKSATIDQVLALKGLPDVKDFIDIDAVSEKAKKDSRINTSNFDNLSVEAIIESCCRQLNISIIGSVYNQSERLLANLNEQDRKIVADQLDLNESTNTLS